MFLVFSRSLDEMRLYEEYSFYSVWRGPMGYPEKNCIVAEDVEHFFMNEAISLADIMGPNLFELELLTGKHLSSLEDVVNAARELINKGVKKVRVKYLAGCTRDKEAFEMVLVTEQYVLHISRPLYPFAKEPVGVGGLTCGILFACLVNGLNDRAALEITVNIVDAVMKKTGNVKAMNFRLLLQEILFSIHLLIMALKNLLFNIKC